VKPKPTKALQEIVCQVSDMGVDGLGVARLDGKVYFVEGGLPGDKIKALVFRDKGRYAQARMVEVLEPSEHRIEPLCPHFGYCGGCKWQNLNYPTQLAYKSKQVYEALTRLGGFSLEEVVAEPALAAPAPYRFRNKLEFTFTARRWLLPQDFQAGSSKAPPGPSEAPEPSEAPGPPGTSEAPGLPGLGFHLSGRFERILHIDSCYLMDEEVNLIRNTFYREAVSRGLTFYHPKTRQGYLRNLMVRNTKEGCWLVLLSVRDDNPELLKPYLLAVQNTVEQTLMPGSVQWLYTVNSKANDSLDGLEIEVFSGQNKLYESLDGLRFGISATSFFQTNPRQAEAMYRQVRDWCGLSGQECVYDLYTGTGSIALFLAPHAGKVVGVEYVASAVEDARQNALLNNIQNATFVAGDMAKILNTEFYLRHGYPEVVVVDPPRAGMHPEVVQTLLQSGASRIVYVSCNPATQARDLQGLSEQYRLERYRPLDLFPQTAHIENLALLVRKE
jgi:23S rRNA (uracil1939-C5)-methyltransferase